MEEVVGAPQLPLFNGPLETGVRSVVILEATFPIAHDLARLTWLDHLVVHTGDLGGPESLHPDIPQRTGELLVRRRLIEEGLVLMGRLHLIATVATTVGIEYTVREEATAFVDTLRTNYGRSLRERARWLADKLKEMSNDELGTLITERIGRWAIEFQGENPRRAGTLL